MTERKSWYRVGYDEGFAGTEERPPEQYTARNCYRAGWADGDIDRRLVAAGYKANGPAE